MILVPILFQTSGCTVPAIRSLVVPPTTVGGTSGGRIGPGSGGDSMGAFGEVGDTGSLWRGYRRSLEPLGLGSGQQEHVRLERDLLRTHRLLVPYPFVLAVASVPGG